MQLIGSLPLGVGPPSYCSLHSHFICLGERKDDQSDSGQLMGGYGSGLRNPSFRPTVESTRRLSAHDIRAVDLFRPGERSEAIVGELPLEVDLRDDRAPQLRVATHDDEPKKVLLRATPQPFGDRPCQSPIHAAHPPLFRS